MEIDKQYSITISTGDLDNDFLVAEIYTKAGTFIGSVFNNGSDTIVDFSCEADNEVCKGERTISLIEFVGAMNETFEALEIKSTLINYEINNMSDDFFVNIYDKLKEHVPEFTSDCERDEQYMIMYEFGVFLEKNIENEEILGRCIKFINEGIEKGSNITEEVIALEVFQKFYDAPESILKIRRHMSEYSRLVFDYNQFCYKKTYG